MLLFQLCKIITKPLQNLQKFHMHIKAKTSSFFISKKTKIVQNQEKAFGVTSTSELYFGKLTSQCKHSTPASNLLKLSTDTDGP